MQFWRYILLKFDQDSSLRPVLLSSAKAEDQVS